MKSAALVLIATALLAGHAKAAPPAAPPANRPAAAKPAVGPYKPVALTNDWRTKVQLVSVTHEQWLRELEALHGRIVVVDNWATWCVPCVERFPRMMKIARKWSSPGIVFVTLSLDDHDDPQSLTKVRKFLEKQDARIPNYLMNEITPDAFDKLNLLGIPAVFIYDRNGRLTHRLTGDNPNNQYTEADLETALRKIAAGK